MFFFKLKIFLIKPSLNSIFTFKDHSISFFGTISTVKSQYWLGLLFCHTFIYHFNLLQSHFHSHRSFASLKLCLPRSILSPPGYQSQPAVLDKFDLSLIFSYCPYPCFYWFCPSPFFFLTPVPTSLSLVSMTLLFPDSSI